MLPQPFLPGDPSPRSGQVRIFLWLVESQFSLHDPLSVAVAIDPTLIDVRELAVAVDFVEPERGRTRIVGPGSVRVATSVDAQRSRGVPADSWAPTARHGDMRIAVS